MEPVPRWRRGSSKTLVDPALSCWATGGGSKWHQKHFYTEVLKIERVVTPASVPLSQTNAPWETLCKPDDFLNLVLPKWIDSDTRDFLSLT
jgi:hypothetical protein